MDHLHPAPSARDRDSFVFKALIAEQPRIRGMLRALGVHPQDRDDLAQQILFGAWRAIEAGRYRPDPDGDPLHALRSWLGGIARRQTVNYLGRAHRRREIAVVDLGEIAATATADPEDWLAARECLRDLVQLRAQLQEVLVRVAIGHEVTEVADLLRLPRGTVSSRLRRARQLLLERRSR